MGNDAENMNQASMEKTTYDKTVSKMKIGVCEMQGWRQTMEDAAIVLPNFQPKTSLFGILDGHGGSIISEFVSVNFKNVLIRTKSYINGEYEQALVQTFLIMDELLKDKDVNDFIYNTHHNLIEKEKEKDKEILSRSQTMLRPEKNKFIKLRFETGIYEYDLNSINLLDGGEGTTTTVFEHKMRFIKPKNENSELNITKDNSSDNMKFEDIFFAKGGKKHPGTDSLPLLEDVFEINTININFEDNSDNSSYRKKQINQKNINRDKFVSNEMGTTANIMLIKNGVIYIANVGDSLSVMYKNRKAYNLNKEHQIVIDSEKERVLKSGATIVGYRINGMLNLTRAIGDLKFKSNQNLKRHEQSVIAVPEITKIEYTDDIDFIIMGCDGVWDCVKRQMVCDFVDKQIRENPDKDLSEILKLIFDRCVSPVWGVVLGTDNMSCIIIQFLKDGDTDENNIIARKINFGESVEELEKENILQN